MKSIEIFKLALKKFINNIGFDIRRCDPSTRGISLNQALDAIGVTVLFDVGANIGQFAQQVRCGGYKGRIVSFEPLSDEWGKLHTRSKSDPMWLVHERCALGTSAEYGILNVSENSVSSSLVRMLDTHINAAPKSKYIRKEKISVFPLDQVFSAYVEDESVIFVKLDAQGYEGPILCGAEKLLRRTSGLICELSLLDLYEGQWSLVDIVGHLSDLGFDLWSVTEGFVDQQSGRVMQLDGIFLKREVR